MIAKPIASAAMLTVILGALGGAALQQGAEEPQAAVTQIEPVDVAENPPSTAEPAETAPEVEPEPVAPVTETEEAAEAVEAVEPEETAIAAPATPPARVVESAGFPVVPDAEQEEDAPAPSPVVTVNGRPVGTPGTPGSTRAAVAARPDAATPSTGPNGGASEVAVIEPPRPIPRPQGLESAPQETDLDYAAIANVARGEPARDLFPLEPPRPIGAPQVDERYPNAENGVVRDPSRDDLVGVVGPSGQIIWVYEEQLRSNNSQVTFEAPQPVNPFGFVFE